VGNAANRSVGPLALPSPPAGEGEGKGSVVEARFRWQTLFKDFPSICPESLHRREEAMRAPLASADKLHSTLTQLPIRLPTNSNRHCERQRSNLGD
jgi:hypothetical protein